MPSNAMKMSQLIEQLQRMREQHGDLDCLFAIPGDATLIAIDGRNVAVAGELLGQKLPQPALVLGLTRDEAGRLRNHPGQRYAATADASEWTYDRALAPEGEDLAVWKRLGGRDIGRREGERWFVREGAEAWPRRPIEIIPDGILAWRRL